MDAKQYADEIVDPTIEEFENDPRSQRRAFLACVGPVLRLMQKAIFRFELPTASGPSIA